LLLYYIIKFFLKKTELALSSNFLGSLCAAQGSDFFTEEGYPRVPFPHGWKGESGLYSVGFTRRGLSGVSSDAVKVAQDIAVEWEKQTSTR
jgi:hypothetical protein